ncbi:hypothetical protein ACLK1S_11645 [Escherichia coli]
MLYPAMENYQLDIMIGEGPRRAPLKLICRHYPDWCNHARGSLTSPLRDRFGIVQRLGVLSGADLQYTVSRGARLWGLNE